ncbi:MAG TPA: double zinc ribbon domain-containing protein [Baekduia sp.]|nr:double zinc ribbon domain-containing protein [Baekduia sp.]
MVEALLALVVPAVCVACRRAGDVARTDPLCRSCRQELPWLGASLCARCGLPGPCGPRCPARAQAFSGAWAPVAYAGAVPSLVNALKERGAVGLARLMAAQIAATAPPGWWAGPMPVALVPVPADPLRRRRRGVDHAARLAAELAPRCGLPVAPVLTRPMTIGGRQAGRSRAQRLAPDNLAVVLRTGRRAPSAVPAAAILVDDVHTTGATLHACALALRESGALDVRAVTYARALRDRG